MQLTLIATTTFGLEAVVRREIESLGYEIISTENGKVTFSGNERAIARCNLCLRCADRLLIRMANEVYIEPLNLPVLRRIIKKEKPDSILPTLGGQMGLTLSMQLAKEGFLEANGVKLLGADPDTIDKAEDRQKFKDMPEDIWILV